MAQLQCSFCGKQQDRVKRLIAGPGVYICDECVGLCQEILDEGPGGDRPSGRSDHPRVTSEAVEGPATEMLDEDALRERLGSLSYRERRVLELRYGLSGEQPRTLSEIGQTFKLTGEEVRNIENESLKRLQGPADPRP